MTEWERERERGHVVSHWYLWFDTACADGLTKGFLLEKKIERNIPNVVSLEWKETDKIKQIITMNKSTYLGLCLSVSIWSHQNYGNIINDYNHELSLLQ